MAGKSRCFGPGCQVSTRQGYARTRIVLTLSTPDMSLTGGPDADRKPVSRLHGKAFHRRGGCCPERSHRSGDVHAPAPRKARRRYGFRAARGVRSREGDGGEGAKRKRSTRGAHRGARRTPQVIHLIQRICGGADHSQKVVSGTLVPPQNLVSG